MLQLNTLNEKSCIQLNIFCALETNPHMCCISHEQKHLALGRFNKIVNFKNLMLDSVLHGLLPLVFLRQPSL